MVALIFTNLAFAYTVYEIKLPGIGLFNLSKEYYDGYLFFILKMPVEMGEDDIFFLWLDFQADGETDGFVTVQRDYWYYVDAYGNPPQPSWMTESYDSVTNTLSIGIATRNREGSPLGSVPTYSFALVGEHAGTFIIFPEELEYSPEFPLSSDFEKEVLSPEFVIPETPLGTITAIMSMVFAFILYRKIGH